MKRVILIALFALAFAAGGVSAQTPEPTPVTPMFSESFMATQAAYEAAVDRLPTIESATLVNSAPPIPTPTVIEIPEGGADVTDTGDVIVIVQKQDEGKNVVIVALFALILVLVVVVVWQADRLRVMIPAPLVPVLEKGADVALEAGDTLAKGTTSTIDDSLVQLIRDLKESFFEALRRTPPAETPPPPSAGATINVPAGSTITALPAVPEQGAVPSHPLPQTPQQPSAEAVREFTGEGVG
jgi:hypothetical protein